MSVAHCECELAMLMDDGDDECSKKGVDIQS